MLEQSGLCGYRKDCDVVQGGCKFHRMIFGFCINIFTKWTLSGNISTHPIASTISSASATQKYKLVGLKNGLDVVWETQFFWTRFIQHSHIILWNIYPSWPKSWLLLWPHNLYHPKLCLHTKSDLWPFCKIPSNIALCSKVKKKLSTPPLIFLNLASGILNYISSCPNMICAGKNPPCGLFIPLTGAEKH